ncbi:5-formyltetrahydrofolate cyclo-ligase, partial [Conidiobolus coronatus NRRL 28638]
VAFDRSKNRLGHGKGYYDNFLAKHKQLFNRYPAMVAISLTEQIQSEPVPVDEHDVKLDKILTCDEDIE